MIITTANTEVKKEKKYVHTTKNVIKDILNFHYYLEA